MNAGPSGFRNAPVTRAFVIGSAALTVVFGVRGSSSRLGLSSQDVFKKLHLWKLIASTFAFSSTPELLFGLFLLYYFRVFERQIGSNKYSVFILFSTIVSLLLEVLALGLIKDPTLNALAPGPYGLVFSSFVPFFFDIPISSRVRIFGVQFTDKSFIYLAGLQLLFSSWKRSLLPGICGVLAGFLYHLNVFGICRIQFPELVASFFSRLSRSSSEGSPHNLSSGNIPRNLLPQTGRRAEASYPLPAPTSAPPRDMVATLVSMGFDTDSAQQALMVARNDINVATNILLEAQSH